MAKLAMLTKNKKHVSICDCSSSNENAIENESKKVKGIYKSNDNTGKFIMLVDPEKSYNIVIESDDYHTFSAELEFDVNKEELFEYTLEKKN
mgnify:CR=1 FL=1